MPAGVYEWNQIVFLNIDGEDLTCSVNDNHTISLSVSRGNETKLIGDLVSVQESGSGDLVHEKETHFGEDEHDTKLWAVLHEDWEVTSLLHLEIC